MPRKPIVPVFAGVSPAPAPVPAIPLYAGDERNVEPPPLPLAIKPLSIGTEWHLAVLGVLALLILVAYGNSFQSEWVLDNKYIIELDPRTKSVSWDDADGKAGVRNIFTQDYWWPKGISGLYRPITSFTYWLNWTAFKNGYNATPREQVVGFHWINLGVHFLNAFLFYMLMLRLTRHFWVSFFASAIFATHPVATESVTNIIGRADMFAATTVVGGMLLYINTTRTTGLRKVLWLIALMLLAIFGMFSKESSIAVGVVVGLYDLIYRVGDRWRQWSVREGVLTLVRWVLILPLFFCGIQLYLLSIVPWLGTFQTGSASFAFAILATMVGLLGLFVSMALLSTRNFWLYAPTLLASMFLICGLAAAKDPKWGYLAGFAISAVVFCGIEFAFKLGWAEETEEPERRAAWNGFFDGYHVLLPALLLMLLVRHWVFENTTPAEEPFLDNPLRGLGFIGSRMTAFKVWTMLSWKLVFPKNLSSDYSYNQIPLFGFHGVSMWQNFLCVLSAMLFAGIGAFGLWCWKKGQKAIAFFVFLYMVNYIPTGNFLFIIGSVMAERFMYLPLIGFSAVLVIGVDLLARRFTGPLDEADTTAAQREQSSLGAPVAPDATAPAPAISNTSPGTEETRHLLRYVPHMLLAVLVVGYGVRAFYRNYAWHTDVTLWRAARELSPLSFRSYQSLAFALFEQDPAGNCDEMIAIDEAGLKIVDDLPNPNNSSRLYLHLGMYYGLKGELLCKQDPQQGLVVTPEARPWFEKSARILERGVPIDRAFNEVNRGRDVKRGRNGEDTPDVGLAPVYSYLGVAYMRLGLSDQAEKAFRYMRHLEPTDPDADAYFKLASAQLQQGKLEDAAVSLMQVILLKSTRNDAWSLLNEVFKKINTEPYPCIIVNGEKAQLDMNRAVVRKTVLFAYRDFVKTFLFAKRTALANSAKDTAVKVYGFDEATLFKPLFDPAQTPAYLKPVPPDPVFYKPGPIKFELLMPEVQDAFNRAAGKGKINEVKVEIVEGRAQYCCDAQVDGKTHRIRVNEEGKLLSDKPVN